MTDAALGPEQALVEAVRDREEAARLQRRLAETQRQVDELTAQVGDRAVILKDEERDVERLESFSPTRIWAGLTGHRDVDLDRETAEREAARYALAEAEARRDAMNREHDAFAEQLRVLGDVEERYAQALAGKEAWIQESGGTPATELADIATRRGTLMAEQHELAEAADAGRRARQDLREGDRVLGSAQSWSSWDTFGGGGLLTDMMKYDRIDEATSVLRRADQAIKVFGRELADVDLASVPGVEVSPMMKTFDVFFDNIFSDWSVRSRVQDASERTRRTLGAVEQALAEVERREQRVADELTELDRRREQILIG